jgi:hypothetical protein
MESGTSECFAWVNPFGNNPIRQAIGRSSGNKSNGISKAFRLFGSQICESNQKRGAAARLCVE